MAQMKNICGKIPVELHTRVRQEIEQKEISTQEFLQKVIEEHFMEKGVDSMTARTIAVQVSEELFARLKAVIAKKRCRQKEFLIEVIEKAIAQAEDEIREQPHRKIRILRKLGMRKMRPGMRNQLLNQTGRQKMGMRKSRTWRTGQGMQPER